MPGSQVGQGVVCSVWFLSNVVSIKQKGGSMPDRSVPFVTWQLCPNPSPASSGLWLYSLLPPLLSRLSSSSLPLVAISWIANCDQPICKMKQMVEKRRGDLP